MTARILSFLIAATCLGAFATQADELVLQAKLAKAQGDVAGAIKLLMTALDLEPKNTTANFDMGFILQEGGKYADAIDYFNKALSAGMSEANLYYNRALCRANLWDLKGAREDNLTAQRLKPDDEDVLFQAAMVEFAAGNQAKACEYIQSIIKSSNITPYHLRESAVLAENCGDANLALIIVNSYLQIRDYDPNMKKLRARVLYKSGNFADSVREWQGVAAESGVKQDWLGGIQAARDGKDTAAEQSMAREIYQRFGDATYLIELGNRLLQSSDFAGAERAFSLLKPEDSLAALWNLAVTQEKQGKLNTARTTWQLYLSISTDSVARAKVEKHLAGLGSEAKQQTKPDTTNPTEDSDSMQGVQCAQEAARLCNAGKYSEALPKWQEAINLLPDMTDLVYNMAGTLEKLDRLEDAKAVWQRYLLLDITPQRKAEIERHLEELNRELERRAQEKIDAANGDQTPKP